MRVRMFLGVEWAKRWLPKVFFLVFVLAGLAVVSTLVSLIHQVEVAQISDLYGNGKPLNLYAVFYHGYPLHWAITTNPIPLEQLDPQLYEPPPIGVSLVMRFQPVFGNFFLDILFYLGIYSLITSLVVILRIRKKWRTKEVRLQDSD